MATKKKPTTKSTEQKEYATPHQLMLMSTAQNASAMEKFSVYGDVDVAALITDLQAKVKTMQDGDTKPLEAMLYGQAQALQSIFTNMARRSAMNAGEYMDATDKYMRLALKAQSQCRATLETLAIVKNPMPYIKQANIAHGHQQVNNTCASTPADSGMTTGAGNFQSEPNKLLEADNGNILDTRAPGASVPAHSDLEALGAIDRAQVARG